MTVHLLGVRHHGPGSARAVREALLALRPAAVLVEGPPEADPLIGFVGDPQLVPPVALLAYAVDDPGAAAFWPFAAFSPEWQALLAAREIGAAASFFDLPFALRLGLTDGRDPDDGLARLAEAAGAPDLDTFWDQLVELRQDRTDVLAAVREAMRAARPDPTAASALDLRREAWMRERVRDAERTHGEVAVVCGAWHVPALEVRTTRTADRALLRGLARRRVQATWVPWTASRLSLHSGYGAGVRAPGWFEHVWTHGPTAGLRWVSRAAGLLRDAGDHASAAHVLDTVRLADALAALRDRPHPGLSELSEAIVVVLCGGDPRRAERVRQQLEVGSGLGQVPDEAPAVPLQRDLDARVRRLRLERSEEARELELDLRKPIHLARSHLLRRLALLGIDWGRRYDDDNSLGTFRETWWLCWSPELHVRVIEAASLGNTVADAATARVVDRLQHEHEPVALATLLEATVFADLDQAARAVVAAVDRVAADAADVRALLAALPPLVRVLRYGDVRGTRVDTLDAVVAHLRERVLVGLPLAAWGLDDEAALGFTADLEALRTALRLLGDPASEAALHEACAGLLERDGVNDRVRGWCCRALVDDGSLTGDRLQAVSSRALSVARPPRHVAAWLEGLLTGSALDLLVADTLWTALDAWVVGLASDGFDEVLPLVRRAFSGFPASARRRLAAALPGRGGVATTEETIDRVRADRVIGVLAALLGTP